VIHSVGPIYYEHSPKEAIRVAVETMKVHAEEFEELTLVLFGEREFGIAKEDYSELIETKVLPS